MRYLAAAALAAALLAPGEGAAQGACGSRDRIVAGLASGYGETRVGLGLAADASMLEVFASAETGAWTITVTAPGGPTCLAASGYAWERMDDELPLPETEN